MSALPPGRPQPKTFTMRMPWDEALQLDQAILDLSARIGRRVDRTEAIRGLARLFVADSRIAELAIEAAATLPPQRQGVERSVGRDGI